MKNILISIILLFSLNSFSQEPTLLYMNSSWNDKNDYKYLSSIKNVKILRVDYDSQPKKFKDKSYSFNINKLIKLTGVKINKKKLNVYFSRLKNKLV